MKELDEASKNETTSDPDCPSAFQQFHLGRDVCLTEREVGRFSRASYRC